MDPVDRGRGIGVDPVDRGRGIGVGPVLVTAVETAISIESLSLPRSAAFSERARPAIPPELVPAAEATELDVPLPRATPALI